MKNNKIKVIKSVYLDLEVIRELQKRKVNLSLIVNSYLINFLELNKKKQELG